MKKVLIILLLTLSAISSATPINLRHIPADSKLFVHVDFDALRNSTIGPLVCQEIKTNHQKQIDGITTLFGTDLTRDLYGLSLYALDADDKNAALLIYAKYDKQKLLALLGMNEEYAESNYQGQTLYHWLNKESNKKQVGTFAADNLIVISQNKNTVTALLDLLKGSSKSIANDQDNALAEMVKNPQGTIMVAATNGLGDIAEGNEQAAILKNSQLMSAVVSEYNGNIKLNVDLIADSTETAINIEKVVQGMQAFLALSYKEMPEIASLIQAINFVRNENQLALTFQYPSTKLIEMIKTHQAMFRQFAEQHHQGELKTE